MRTYAGIRLRSFLLCLSAMSLALSMGLTSVRGAEPAKANDYYVLTTKQLSLSKKVPAAGEQKNENFNGHVYATLDGPGEIYWIPQNVFWNSEIRERETEPVEIAIEVPANQNIKGQLYITRTMGLRPWRGSNDNPPEILTFTLPVDTAKTNRKKFLRAKLKHYESLYDSRKPGTAWFRHQVLSLRKELDLKEPDTDRDDRTWRPVPENEFERTFSLVSGGRALSENLQLDRQLPISKEDKQEVPIISLEGITVAEMDWQPLIKDLDPKTDPLAGLIPADQHAIFFPSFAALVQGTDFADQQGKLFMGMAVPRSESAMSRERYETQLCLPMSTLARLLGPKVISSVAITGGDLYFRTGTDVAVLFEAPNVQTLRALVESRVMLAAVNHPTAKPVTGEVAGVSYRGLRSPDRVVCSYVATVGSAVVVTNSLAQLERIVEASAGKVESLLKLPEYTFFRDRYQQGADGEIGLLILSDATIRRWCGPKWRIATSRRTRAAGILSELQAQQLDHLLKGQLKAKPLTSDYDFVSDLHSELNDWGVSSPVYGSLHFNTPIQELDLDLITLQEAEFYGRWRDGYQQNWRQFFDPIAIQLKTQENRVAVDVTVMPLIAGTDYRELIQLSSGAELKPRAGDLHAETLFHFALAINKDSELLKRNVNFLEGMAPQVRVNPLSWLGETVAFYVDNDKFWQEAAAVAPEEVEHFLEENMFRLPIAIHVDVSNGLKLTGFLAGFRAFIEQTAPGMTRWETKEHAGRSYVKIAATDETRRMVRGEREAEIALFYAPSADSLVVTLNEDVMKRSLERQVAATKKQDKAQQTTPVGKSWIGRNVGVQVQRNLLQVLEMFDADNYQRHMQRLAWDNLSILNEWKRLYPDLSPMELNEKYWHTRLVCPGGGEYVWNEKWQTMESSVYGHPAEPKTGPRQTHVLQDFNFGNFGLTFEHGGLRAKVELDREQAEKNSAEETQGK